MQDYLGGAVAIRTTALTGVNMAGGDYTFSWESTVFDYGGEESESGFWDASAPTRLTVPTYLDDRKVVVRAGMSIPWNNVAIGTDWCYLQIKVNGGSIIGFRFQPGGFEIINPWENLQTRQAILKQGDYIEAQARWRNTETSVDVLATNSGYPHFEIQVLGFLR